MHVEKGKLFLIFTFKTTKWCLFWMIINLNKLNATRGIIKVFINFKKHALIIDYTGNIVLWPICEFYLLQYYIWSIINPYTIYMASGKYFSC